MEAWKSEIEATKEMVYDALRRLATAQVSDNLYMEYLFFVNDIMATYGVLTRALDMEEYRKFFRTADQITASTDLKFDEGFLKGGSIADHFKRSLN